MAHASQQDPHQFPAPYASPPQANLYPYHQGFPTIPPYPPPSQFNYAPGGGHPSFLQPHSSAPMLSQELVAAQRRLLQYTALISNLHAELETIRNIVCHNCKERISPANLASHASHTTAGPPLAVRFSSTDGHSSLSPQTNLPGPQLTLSDPTLPIPVAPSQSPVISNVATPSEPSEASLPPPETLLAGSPGEIPLVAEKPEWSVAYNGEIEQVLDVTFVHAFKHTSAVGAVRFSPDGDFLAAALSTRLGRIQIYDVKTRLMKCFLEEYSGYSYKPDIPSCVITSICYSPDGRYLVIGNFSQVYIWEIASKRLLAAFKEDAWTVDFSPDGRLLATYSSLYASFRLWTMRDGSSKLLDQTESTYRRTIKFSPNGRYLAASCRDASLRLWDVRSGKLVGTWNGHRNSIASIAFSLDGEKLTSGGYDEIMKSWNVRSFKVAARSGVSTEERRDENAISDANVELKLDRHSSDAVRSIAIAPDGKWVVTGSADRRVCIWDMHTGVRQCTLTLAECKDAVRDINFSPVGNYIATTGGREVMLWTYKQV